MITPAAPPFEPTWVQPASQALAASSANALTSSAFARAVGLLFELAELLEIDGRVRRVCSRKVYVGYVVARSPWSELETDLVAAPPAHTGSTCRSRFPNNDQVEAVGRQNLGDRDPSTAF